MRTKGIARPIVVLALVFLPWLISYSQTPPKFLFHWSNTKRLEQAKDELLQNKAPLRSTRSREGQLPVFAIYDEKIEKIPMLYTWSDVVGGMGATSEEFYAKLEPTKDVFPQLLALEVNPKAHVRKVKSVVDVQNFIISGVKQEQLEGIDLVLHENYFLGANDEPVLNFREWIVLSDKAYTKVYSRPEDVLRFVESGLNKLQNGLPIDSHSPATLDFNKNERGRDRALKVLQYLKENTPIQCQGIFGRLRKMLQKQGS